MICRAWCVMAVTVIMLDLAGGVATAQEVNEPAANIRTAWTKLGGEYGFMDVDKNGAPTWRAAKEKPASPDAVPAFRFKIFPVAKLKSVAMPDVPFGLWLEECWFTDSNLKDLTRFKTLTALNLHGTLVSDEGTKDLASMSQLKTVYLNGSQVTDEGAKDLAQLKELQTLFMGETRLSGTGFKELTGLSKLRVLSLRETRVGDPSVDVLKNMKELRILDLSNTQLGLEAVKRLAALPNLELLVLDVTIARDQDMPDLQKALPKVKIER